MPDDRPTPLGFWPAVLLAVVVVGAVAWLPPRAESGLIGEVWTLRSPFGDVSVDLAVLAVGAAVFLLESSNLVVRAALDGEHTWRPVDARAESTASGSPGAALQGEASAGASPVADASPRGGAPSAADAEGVAARAVTPRTGFQGGRLIGPLERMLVLILTLASAYPILAAMLAAKGIVRFPEISRDGETGARAEYFLVGSLVSWVIALGAAFLVWWAAHS
jgi:hypothetical protein